jgi:hypothetical protein
MRSAAKPRAIVLLALCFSYSFQARATELKQSTAEAFQHYVQLTEARMQGKVADQQHYLYFDSLPEKQKQAMLDRLHRGHVVVEQMHTTENGEAIEIPDGLVHDWLAIAFIPGATRDQAVALAQDYSRYAQLYGPDVQQAQVISQAGQHYSVYYRFHRQAVVTVVYNAEFTVDYYLPDSLRGYSIARTVRLAEVQNPGKPDEQEMPVGNDHGYMWRMNLYTRYLEKDNGVYIQVEFLALSRRVPEVFAWLVNPYLRSIPRDYLMHYLMSTRKGLAPTAAPN